MFSIKFLSFLVLTTAAVLIGQSDGEIPGRRSKRQTTSYDDYDDNDVVNNWIDQKLDHFNNTITWRQRYFVNSKYYEPGGPVFLMLEGPGSLVPDRINSDQWIEWAKKLKAICFYVEQRFYGLSRPTPDTRTINLQHLNTKQILADLVNFRQVIELEYALTGAKWIVFGCGHSGATAAWFRLKYPSLVDGVVASDAILTTQNNYEQLEIVADILSNVSSTCVSNIRTAVNQMEDLIAEGPKGWANLTDKFNLCDPLEGDNPRDLSELYRIIALYIGNSVVYNNMSESMNVETLCDVMTNERRGSELDRYAQLFWMLKLDSNPFSTCLSAAYIDVIFAYRDYRWDDGNDNRQLLYQECTELGQLITSDSTKQPFGNRFSSRYLAIKCKDIFGPSFDQEFTESGVNALLKSYGGKNISVTNVVFVTGTTNPYKYATISRNSNDKSKIITIEGASHCQDMNPSAKSDSPQLTQTRIKIYEEIEKWLADKQEIL